MSLDHDLAAALKPTDRETSSNPLIQLARVQNVLTTERPPVLDIGREGLPKYARLGGDMWSYHPGDTVAIMDVGGQGTPLVVCRVPMSGIGEPLEDPDEAEPLDDWSEILGGLGFQNGWVNFDTVYNTAGYYMQPDFWVRLKGTVKSGTDNTAIFTLPVGLRPPIHFYFTGTSNGVSCELVVQTDGVVRKVGGGNNTSVCLDAVTFPTRWHQGAWLRAQDMNGWAYDVGVYNDVAFFVRDDGWTWVKGAVANGTANTTIMATPDQARTILADMHPCMGFGAARHDHGGGANSGRGSGRWLQQTGANGRNVIGGKNWFAHGGMDLPFIDFPYANGWTDLGSALNTDWRRVFYYRDHFNVVHMMGVADGAGRSSVNLGTLPVGYRPIKKCQYPSIIGGNAQGIVEVLPTGVVTGAVSNTGFLTLSSITFRADQ